MSGCAPAPAAREHVEYPHGSSAADVVSTDPRGAPYACWYALRARRLRRGPLHEAQRIAEKHRIACVASQSRRRPRGRARSVRCVRCVRRALVVLRACARLHDPVERGTRLWTMPSLERRSR